MLLALGIVGISVVIVWAGDRSVAFINLSCRSTAACAKAAYATTRFSAAQCPEQQVYRNFRLGLRVRSPGSFCDTGSALVQRE